jgi:hypothetical protein
MDFKKLKGNHIHIRNLVYIQESGTGLSNATSHDIASMEHGFVNKPNGGVGADVVVTAHGTSVTNLFYAKNASVIELLSRPLLSVDFLV